MSAVSYPVSPAKHIFLQILRAFLFGCILFAIGVVVSVVAFLNAFDGRIFPGVTMAGKDLSGMTPQEAAAQIAQTVDFPQRGRILIHDGAQTWTVTPVELGFFLDPESSATVAYEVGRTGNLVQRLSGALDAWFSGSPQSPILVFDQRVAQTYVLNLARQIDKPVIEATLGLEGAEVVVRSGQVGRKLDTAKALTAISAQVTTLQDGVVSLPVTETPPVILDATEQADLARKILSEPLTLTIPNPQEGDPGPWTFDPTTLASMLTIEKVDAGDGASKYQVVINTDSLRLYLNNLAPELQRKPKMPRFTFNDQSGQLEVIDHAVIGRDLDVDASVKVINEKLAQGEHNIPLTFILDEPPVTDASTGESLGIKELIHTETSYFYGSSAARVQNITTAAARFHGVLVAPGETFSMATTLGDISLDNGYAEALIIYGDQTIQGVGGGVCQVSTTLFRAAFFTGFPIDERHAHAYRVLYYEKVAGNKVDTDLAGLDATVFVPLVDFKFTNDTPYWLLMETYVNPSASSITWKFYSTSDGRSVDYTTTGLTNIVKPPEPIYKENPDLAKDEIKQVDWKVEGADVNIQRTVTRNGEVYLKDSFFTRFQPWRDIFEYGPGTEIPSPEPTPEGQ